MRIPLVDPEPISPPADWTVEKDMRRFRKIYGDDDDYWAADWLFQGVCADHQALQVMLSVGVYFLIKDRTNSGYWSCRALALTDLLDIACRLLAERASSQKQQVLVEKGFLELRFAFNQSAIITRRFVESQTSVTLYELGVLTDWLHAAGHDLFQILSQVTDEAFDMWFASTQGDGAEEWGIPAEEVLLLNPILEDAPWPLFVMMDSRSKPLVEL